LDLQKRARDSLSLVNGMVTFISDARAAPPLGKGSAKPARRFAGLDEACEQHVNAELPPSPPEQRQMDSERRAGPLLKTGGPGA
jgi:hypothetical protein